MVNRGRSAGCLTCKQRRVKCDETKPQCRACTRLDLRCEGYATPKHIKLKFKDQNHKFFRISTSTSQDIDAHSTASSSRSSRSDDQGQEHETAIILRRPSEPDTAVSFYLSHYARMGRDLDSSRGFFEMLIPAYFSQPQDSALSLAVSTLASEVLSGWRHDPGSFRTPRQSYTRAITRLRVATQNPIERSKPATALAVLVLQTYENVCAIYDLRSASSTHHDGAASLLCLVDTDDTDKTLRAYLRKFMLHTEVSTAIRQKKPLRNVAYSWIENGVQSGATDNPSSALDAIGVSIAELQAKYTQFELQDGDTLSRRNLLSRYMVEAKGVSAKLMAWTESVPDHWRPSRLITGREVDSSIPSYQCICEVYPSCQIASIWNLWRFQRLLLVKITLSFAGAFSAQGPTCAWTSADRMKLADCQTTLQDIVDNICYSIPFYLGNRFTRTSLTDFDSPTISLPCDYFLGDLLRSPRARMSNNDHRRHIIAQGPWRAMHPLSRLLTLFSEEHGDCIARLLRPGQREWIRDQFQRVATILHLPLKSRTYSDSTGLPTGLADVRVEYQARDIRKGAILMSGP